MKIQKTNAMRILDSKQLSYEVLSYAHGKEAVAGLDVAKQLEENPEQVFKTLVTVANTKEYIVFVIPVAHELHLKKCAKAAGVKSVEMINPQIAVLFLQIKNCIGIHILQLYARIPATSYKSMQIRCTTTKSSRPYPGRLYTLI